MRTMRRTSRPQLSIFAPFAVAAALAFAGCGDNEVLVNVDILSFIDADQQSGDYAAPPGLVMPPLAIEPQAITLPEGLAGAIDMTRLELSFSMDFAGDAQSGEGLAEIRLYIAPSDSGLVGSDVYQTEPVYTGVVALGTGTTTTHTGLVEANEANDLLSIFEGGGFLLGIAFVIDTSASLDPVSGRWTIRRMEALVAGTGDVF